MAKATIINHPPRFKPVTLTAETKEEADALWHILNNTGNLQEYWKNRGFDEDKSYAANQACTRLWQAFREVHHT